MTASDLIVHPERPIKTVDWDIPVLGTLRLKSRCLLTQTVDSNKLCLFYASFWMGTAKIDENKTPEVIEPHAISGSPSIDEVHDILKQLGLEVFTDLVFPVIPRAYKTH
jgi:hypothetical protein